MLLLRTWHLLYGRSAAVGAVASLAYFVYFFSVQLRTTTASTGATAELVASLGWNLALFTAFAAHHSVMARTRAKRWISRVLSAHLERATYVWIASLLLALTCWAWARIPGLAYQFGLPGRMVGHVLQATGLLILVRAGSRMDPLALVGLTQIRDAFGAGAGSSTRSRRPTASLEARGLYRVVRHPIYLGGLLMLWGAPTMTIDRLLVVGLGTTYVMLAIPWEERSLEREYGDAYRAYVSGVRWRILPGIY